LTIPIAGVALWICSKANLNARPSVLAILAVTVSPAITIDFLNYELGVLLGDAFDLVLAFEISGRSLTEVVAVAGPHLVAPVLLILGAAVFLLLSVWLFKRYVPGWRPLPRADRRVGYLLQAGALVGLSILVICVARISSDTLDYALQQKPSGNLAGAIGNYLSDIDGDGYGIVRRPPDPGPFDANVVPYALEIPGNGVDENGVGGDLPSGLPQYREKPGEAARWAHRPNVILIVLESFRADLIGATFNGREVTPILNRLAREGVSASLAFSHNGFTAPSRRHMFRGSVANIRGDKSLVDDFKANGYRVAVFSAEDTSFGGPKFDVGFSRADVAYDARVEPKLRYTTFTTAGSIALPYQVMVKRISAFFESRNDPRPLFMHINLQDAHFPYHHSQIKPLINGEPLLRNDIRPERREALWATYLNTAANVDRAVGEILATAKRSLGDPKPGILITSDHGESLFDDSFLGHGIALTDVQLRVPLIVVNLPAVIKQPIGHAQLRDVIWDALEALPEGPGRPQVKDAPDAFVFNYLGDFRYPRQISLRRLGGRTIYDFRTRRFRLPDGTWQHPENLDENSRRAFLELVHLWERMVLVGSGKE
jgi:hypothetical protein